VGKYFILQRFIGTPIHQQDQNIVPNHVQGNGEILKTRFVPKSIQKNQPKTYKLLFSNQ
jgi:hypothetical protein